MHFEGGSSERPVGNHDFGISFPSCDYSFPLQIRMFLQKINQCQTEMRCKKACRRRMYFFWDDDLSQFVFCCPGSKCVRRRVSMLKDTFLFNQRTPLRKLVMLYFYMTSWKSYNQKSISELVIIVSLFSHGETP